MTLPVLTAIGAIATSCLPWSSSHPDPASTEAVSGHYRGTVQTEAEGELPVSANLRSEQDSLVGSLVTPLGTFPLGGRVLPRDRLLLRFVAGDGEEGTLTGSWKAGEIRGRWRLSEEGGRLSLRRTGPPEPPLDERTAPDLSISTASWREDLRFLAAELPRRHGDAFHRVSRDRFERAVDDLDQRIGSLQGHEVLAAMGEIVALVGDGHTYLEVPPSLRRYPLRLRWFGDDLRVIRTTAGHEGLLGSRVLTIGGTDLEEARKRVGRQIAGGENRYYKMTTSAHFLTIAELLHAHGIASRPDRTEWTIEIPSGRTTTVLEPLEEDTSAVWISAAASEPLYRRRPNEALFCQYLEGPDILYVRFRGYPPRPRFEAFFDGVFRAAGRNRVQKLVIDLRGNRGGDFTKFRDLVLPRLKEHRLNHPGRLFVAIDRGTFSAAMTNAADLRTGTRATLVGEPTGARPNGWQEKREFRLPNSRLVVSYSMRYYRFLEGDPAAVTPHVPIPTTWADFEDGRDPVLGWIASRPSSAAPEQGMDAASPARSRRSCRRGRSDRGKFRMR